MHFVQIVICLMFQLAADASPKVHNVYWNRANPIFRQEDHVIRVNLDNEPWEYDQLNIICPVSKPGSSPYPETHVIYSVSEREFENCRITNPKPKIVAICNRPYDLIYFTITFRLFTPMPGGLEFKPGQDYYFISTSSQDDLHRRVGGGCATHNMKMIFKVAESQVVERKPSLIQETLDDIPDVLSNSIFGLIEEEEEESHTVKPASSSSFEYIENTLMENSRNYLYRNLLEDIDDEDVYQGGDNKALKYSSSSVKNASSWSMLTIIYFIMNF